MRAAGEHGLEIEVDSAGTGSWHVGDPPHPESVAAGAKAGLEVIGRARKFIVDDFDRFDVIVVMDRANLQDLHDLAPNIEAKAKVRLFRTYDPATDADEVPDPWGGPTEGYEETIRIVNAAADGLVSTLTANGHLLSS